MSGSLPKRVKLRPTGPKSQSGPNEDTIKKNLEPLWLNVEKKRRAQEAFYQNNGGISPLKRGNNKPIKYRLGVPTGTNSTFVLPKLRLRKPTLNNKITTRKRQMNIAQQRLNQIRNKHKQMLSTPKPNRLKLHRVLRDGPQNFQISVKNNSSSFQHQIIKRFCQILDERLQFEILQIQSSFKRKETFIPTEVTPVTTEVTTHERFSKLK